MPYRGRLSPFCEFCRRRRLKCDQKKPSCGQCIRANRQCVGYRDVSGGRFCDQSDEIRKKNQPSVAGEVVCKQSPSSWTLYSSFPSQKKQRRDHPESLLLQQLSIPLSDQGVSFFLATYVGDNGPSQLRGHLAFLFNIFTASSGGSRLAISASINAVGLAALSNIHMSPKLMLAARQEYVTALAETNTVLSDQVLSTSDATLTSVMLLSMYEIMTCQGPPLMDRWLDHLEGFTKLIELRGSAQLQDAVGLELFSQFRMNIVLGNIWVNRPTPPWLVRLSTEALVYHDNSQKPGDELFLLLSQVCDLCARVKDGLYKEPMKVVKTALNLDTELLSCVMSLNPSWHYTVVKVSPDSTVNGKHRSLPHVYGDEYHIYPNIVVSSWWNYYRFARLILHQVICSTCEYMGQQYQGTGRAYRQTVLHSVLLSQQLAEDICASIPFFFGATESSPEEDFGGVRATGVIRAIWPLFVAGDCYGTTPRMVEWIPKCLEKIGRRLGIRQAMAMSELLAKGQHLNWLTDEIAELMETC